MMDTLHVNGPVSCDDLGGLLQENGFGLSYSAGRTTPPGPDHGSGDADYAGTDGLDLSGFASLGRSLAGLSAASSHDPVSSFSSGVPAAGLSLGAAPSDLFEVGSAGALSLDATVLKGIGASGLSDSHDFGRSAIPAGASASSFASAGTDASGKADFGASGASAASDWSAADTKALFNLDAADTFHFTSDLGRGPVWSFPQDGVHYDLTGHLTFDDLLGADHAVLADYGIGFDGLHTDPLKDVAHASQVGDDFHVA